MAHPIRLLAKLTTKGVRIDGGPAGGAVDITPQDVAAALAMPARGRALSAEGLLVGASKYCDDNESQKRLKAHLVRRFAERARREGWCSGAASALAERCDGLAVLCVFELCWPTHCIHCLGRGRVWHQIPRKDPATGDLLRIDREWRPCPRCKTSGRKRLSDTDRAKVAGIGKSQFCGTWRARADSMMREIYSAEDEVIRHLWAHFAAVMDDYHGLGTEETAGRGGGHAQARARAVAHSVADPEDSQSLTETERALRAYYQADLDLGPSEPARARSGNECEK